MPDEHGKPLYRYKVSRRFNIFGLSQIFFDRTRMRRAAAFLVARQLVDHWLRPPALNPAAVGQLAQEDLFGTGTNRTVTKTGEKGDPLQALSYDALRDEVMVKLRDRQTQSSYWTELDGQVAEIRRKIEDGVLDAQSHQVLDDLLAQHRPLLDWPQIGEPGEALRTFRRNRELLIANAETRLRLLFRYRVQQLGLPGAALLFKEYDSLLQKELHRALENKKPQRKPALSGEWLERLREARRVPWPLKNPAMRIELRRGLATVHRHLAADYHFKAVPEILACLERAKRCVSVARDQEGSYSNLLLRLTAAFAETTGAIVGVRQVLQSSFDQLSRHAEDIKETRKPGTQETRHKPRAFGLLPNWDDQDKERRYEKEMRRVLPTDRGEGNIDWQQVETKVLEQLRLSGKPNWSEVFTLSDLALRFVQLERVDPVPLNTVEELARDLSEACEVLLAHFADNISAVTSFLEADPAKREEFLQGIRMYSGPFLRKSSDITLPDDHRVKTSLALLGVADSFSPQAQKFRATLVETGGTEDTALRDAVCFDHPDDALVLYQECVGIPLCYYAELEKLGELYDKSPRKPETFFDYDAFKGGKLPEIRKLSHRREMANSVEPVLLAIMTGVLKFEDGNFWLQERRSYGNNRQPMGKRFEDVIKQCGDNPQQFEEIRSQFHDWRRRAVAAGGEKLAILWCATVDFKEEVRRRFEAHRTADPNLDSLQQGTHPLLAILGSRMMDELKKWLRGLGAAGERWLDSPLNLDVIVQDRSLEEDQRAQLLSERTALLDGCYSLLDPQWIPIPILHPDARLKSVADGFAPGLKDGKPSRGASAL